MRLEIMFIYTVLAVSDGERRLPDDRGPGGTQQYVGRRTPDRAAQLPLAKRGKMRPSLIQQWIKEA